MTSNVRPVGRPRRLARGIPLESGQPLESCRHAASPGHPFSPAVREGRRTTFLPLPITPDQLAAGEAQQVGEGRARVGAHLCY